MRGISKLGLLLALPASVLVAPSPAAACASAIISLAEFEGPFADPFYAVEEGSSLRLVIQRGGHDCQQGEASVDLDTPPATAVVGDDYTRISENDISLPAPGLHSTSSVQRFVPTTADTDTESLESVSVELSGVQGAGLGVRRATGYIVDNDGAQRFTFGPWVQSQQEVSVTVKVPVIAAGPIAESTTLDYAIEPGTATEGQDYTASNGTLTFSSAQRLQWISFKILNDTASEADETLSISLTGGTIEGDATKTFTIIDNEEKSAPTSRFHHPKKGVLYDYNDYRLREVHVFTSDDAIAQDTGVARAEIALRKKMKSGECKWWNGEGFTKGPCAKRKWFKTRKFDKDFYYYRFPRLRPTVGTSIKKYTGYSRATDLAGNIETDFDPGRNANSFRIDRRRKG